MATSTKIEYDTTNVFQKDLKQLLKKFQTLEEDLETAKRNAIELYHIGKPNAQGIYEKKDSGAILPMPGFCTGEILVCKIKKFTCKALKGRGVMSGIRVIYAYHVAILKVEFIEIYFKGEKKNEDRERIKEYLKNQNPAHH